MRLASFVLPLVCLIAPALLAQSPAPSNSGTPRVIKFSSAAPAGSSTATFSLYDSQDATTPLWVETQVIAPDDNGHYSVLLGSASSQGLPPAIFESTAARWIGVKIGDATETARVLIVSVPYALKAADADTLGGRPLSDFVLSDTASPSPVSTDPTTADAVSSRPRRLLETNPLGTPGPNAPGDAGTLNHLAKFMADGTTLGDSGIVEANGNLGIGTSTPHFPFELVGSNVEFLQRNPDPLSYAGMRFYNDQNSATRALEIDYSGSAFPGVNVFNGPTGESASMATTGAFPLTLGTNNTVRVTIGSTGNVGIGTTTPRFPIELVGSNVEFLQRNPDPLSYSGMRFYNDQNNALRALEIDYSGSAFPSVNVLNGPVGESASVATTGPFPLTLGTNNTARVTIGSTGNVGIGTTTPRFPIELVGSNVEFLQRNPDPSSYSGMRFYNDQNSATRALEIDYSGSAFPGANVFNGPLGESASVATTGAFPLTLGTNNTARVFIASSGNVGVNNNAPVAKLDVSQNAAGLDPNSFDISSTPPSAVHGDTTATSAVVAGVFATTSSVDGYGVLAENLALGQGSGFNSAVRGISAKTTAFGTGVWGDALQLTGDNIGVFGRSASTAGTGVQGQATATTGDAVGVYGLTSSSSGVGVWGDAQATSASNPIPVGVLGRATAGTAGLFTVTNNSATLLLGTNASGSSVFRIDSTGRGFFNGGTQASGADFAESVEVAEQKSAYEPGDLMAIDTTGARRFAKASQPYSTLVAGIYSTKPGVLATPHPMDDPRVASTEIPLAVVGIVPCKVTNENGEINAGDLLVSSSTAGYAMKGTDRNKMTGAVVGKALQAMHGKSGVIEVLVSLQ